MTSLTTGRPSPTRATQQPRHDTPAGRPGDRHRGRYPAPPRLRRGEEAGWEVKAGPLIDGGVWIYEPRQRLPHQLQRILRTTGDALPSVHDLAEQALGRLRTEMAA
jgi:hypothetical protein